MKNRIIIIASVCIALLGMGIGFADAANTNTQLNNGDTATIFCNGKNPHIQVQTPYASADVLTCHSTPATTTTTTRPTTTTTTTVPPTTTTTVPPTTTTTQPTTGLPCVTGDNALDGGGSGNSAFPPPTSINNSNGFNTYVETDLFSNVNLGTGSNLKLCGSSPSSWNVTANAAAEGGEVQAYPDVQQLYDDYGGSPTPIAQAGAPTVTSTFNITDPTETGTNNQWEAAYDLWSDNYSNDIMVWEDTTPARLADNGAVVVNTNVVIDGVSYTLLQNGGCTPLSCLAVNKGDGPQPEMMFVNNTNTTSGGINADSFMKYLEGQGIVPATDDFTQVDFGWEICETNGQPLTFTVNNYTLTRTPVQPS